MNETIAKWVLKQADLQIMFFCGSWGKTMSRSAIEYLLQKSEKKIRSKDVKKDVLQALAKAGKDRNVLWSAAKQLVSKDKPDMLLLELHGQQQLSEELISMMKDPILVIPWISPQDIEQAGSMKDYLKQHALMTKKTAKLWTVIYNQDIPELGAHLQTLGLKKVLSFGLSEQADMQADSISWKYRDEEHVHNDHRVQGMVAKVQNAGSSLPLRFNGMGSVASVYALLSALSVAKEFGMNLVDSLPILRDYQGPAGRWRFIPGIKKTQLIDDSYDSDLQTALFTFSEASSIKLPEGKKRFAVFSDMPKSGQQSETFHCLLGTELANMPYDYLIGVGERSADALHCAEDAGIDRDHLFHFLDVAEAGKFIQHQLKTGDLVVIKGSKEMGLEAITKELMAFPLRAKEDLVQR